MVLAPRQLLDYQRSFIWRKLARFRLRVRAMVPESARLPKKRILIVDDDPSIRYMLSRVLLDEGYNVLSAANGRQGLELAFTGQKKKPPGKVPPPISVSTTNAVKGNIDETVLALGTVTPVYTAMISPRVDGQLVKVNYTEGQWSRPMICWRKLIQGLTRRR
jgi:CheY-like chemotaxis protein